jgi:ubiquinone/menaquinone biosynthesis C-methylase UbiE
LLREIYRILKAGGRFLLAEPARTKTSLRMRGPGARRLKPLAYWRRLLQNAGFRLTQERNVVDMYVCFCVEKPLSGEIQQLTLDLGI